MENLQSLPPGPSGTGYRHVDGRNSIGVDGGELQRDDRRSVTESTPVSTNDEPMTCIQVTTSPRNSQAMKIVDTGPIEPISEVCAEPIRRIPAESMNTGNTVENTAMTRLSS